jgi:hypothetical protein
MKNVVECPREFLAYFNALETYSADLLAFFKKVIFLQNLNISSKILGFENLTSEKSSLATPNDKPLILACIITNPKG